MPEQYVINLCASTTPMALEQPKSEALKRFTFFISRRREDGRERFRLHMGYFSSPDEAQEWLTVVRELYPAAWVGEAPGKKLRAAARAAASCALTAAEPAAAPTPAPVAAPAVAPVVAPVVTTAPATAAALPCSPDADGNGRADPFNPADSIATAAKFNCVQYNEVRSISGNNTKLMLAAYNAGLGAVQKYGGIPPYAETEDYVTKVLNARDRVAPQFSKSASPA